MMKKNLVFVPYQDIYDFSTSGIMTREYAMLTLLSSYAENLYCIGKPRTLLDAKYYNRHKTFTQGSQEFTIKGKIDQAAKLRHFSIINADVVFKKRAWWPKGYRKTIPHMDKEQIPYEDTLLYSNNPFAYELIKHCKSRGATVVFDMMDNFCIHPSLNEEEKNAALVGYSELADISDFFCCNSSANQQFCSERFGKTPVLIKNGVFHTMQTGNIDTPQFALLLQKKKAFKRTVGYIGKLGLRIDEELVSEVSNYCPDTLFVFIGPHLSGQKNEELIKLLENSANILYLGAVVSDQIYNYLHAFDILSIPHAVGERENGGDPLKLYQYLNTKKPIITTSIAGVEEFKDLVRITNNPLEWIQFINGEEYRLVPPYKIPDSIYWEKRAEKLIEFINGKK